MITRPFRQNPACLPPKKDEPALHCAVRLGDHESIRRLCSEGADIDLPFDMRLDEPMGRNFLASPLMVAAGSGYGASLDTMRLLLDLGAKPLLNFGSGSIARFAAAGLGWNYIPGGDAARLRLCLDLGCDPDETDDRGVTLLADATFWGDFDRVKVLIEAGADALTRDKNGRTALFSVQSPKIARLLVDSGSNVDDQDDSKWHPLEQAIYNSSLDGVKALLSVGANVNATHDRGYTVFMSAVSTDRPSFEIMNALVESGCTPNAVTELGWNAFHAAICHSDIGSGDPNDVRVPIRSIFEYLLKLGVDINHKNNQGMTPLAMAKNDAEDAEDDEVMAKVLLELGAKD